MCELEGCGAAIDMPPIEIDDAARRAFLKGAASLPLAAVLFYPDLAAAQGGKMEKVTISTAGGEVSAYLAMPAKTPAPTILLIHEWWGVNDQIKAVAQEFAEQGYVALAVDLYGKEAATTREEAMALVGGLDPAKATQTLVAWIKYLRELKQSTGKVATIGWCFGGGWSLNGSIAAPVDATIIYYGQVSRPAADLAKLSGPVLGHFGTKDKSINAAMVGGFEKAMAEAGKGGQLTVHWYEADHAFANPTGARYDAEDAALAWQRTLAFLKQHMG